MSTTEGKEVNPLDGNGDGVREWTVTGCSTTLTCNPCCNDRSLKVWGINFLGGGLPEILDPRLRLG